MAKNSTPYDPYRSQQEAIRKAKGNPNKNIHHKKNNSNYGGGDYQKEKAALIADQERLRAALAEQTRMGQRAQQDIDNALTQLRFMKELRDEEIAS